MPTILVVEDDAAISSVIEQRLADAEYQVVAASGTAAALAEINSGRPIDLMLLDLVMPADEPDGVAFAATVRSQRPEVPVIFMTGYYGVVVRSGTLPGPIFYKPLDLDALVSEISRHLEQ